MNIDVNSHGQEKNINLEEKKSYLDLRNISVPARPMGPPCNSQFCKKSKFRQCNDICETMRVELFNYFWLDLKSWELRNNMYQYWLTKSQLNKRVHSQIVVVHVGLPIIIIYNVAV